MTFAEKLRELRDAAGLSEAKLAEAAGIPFGTIHTYSMGRRLPGFSAVLKIARALGVTCEAFAQCSDLLEGSPTGRVGRAVAKKSARRKASRRAKPR